MPAAAATRVRQTCRHGPSRPRQADPEGVLGGGKIWADLGSGEGAFTLALADLLGPTGSIHTVDRDSRALQVQVRALRDAFPNVSVTQLVADFTLPLELPPLDWIVMFQPRRRVASRW